MVGCPDVYIEMQVRKESAIVSRFCEVNFQTLVFCSFVVHIVTLKWQFSNKF